MSEIGKKDLTKALEQLAFRSKEELDDNRSGGLIQPEEELYYRWKVDEFQYTEQGATVPSAHGEYITRKTWFRAFIKITEDIEKSDEYSFALELLTEIIGEGKNEISYLKSFVKKIILRCLDESNFSDADIDILVRNFLKDIKGEPLKYGAEVELDGIVILPNCVEFKIGDTKVILRQTRIEDIEKEFPVYGFTRDTYFETPSAILNIEFLGSHANEIQNKVMQAITLLRLFKVGSVDYISYCMHSESITDAMASGTISTTKSVSALEKSLITEEDTQKLKKFWQTMTKALPISFYELGEKKLDHLTIAYQRYCDALLENGILERRIANAVMGLEGLFLKGGETHELTYRLSIRVAKIFSLLGYDSSEVKDVVGDAYKVRSLFVHGDHLSYKLKRKLNGKFGDIGSLLLLLLDYLRIAIILTIFIKKEKEEFLDFIDDALIDKDKDSKLNNLLNTARNVISGE